MVVTSRPNYLKEISTWVARLDFDDGTDSRLYVYPVQNGKAERLAELLSELFGGKAESETYSRGDVAPGHSAQTIGDGTAPARHWQRIGRRWWPRQWSIRSAHLDELGVCSRLLADQRIRGSGREVRVVADTENNTLLIMANADEYLHRERPPAPRPQPLQVLIEASIVEVTLTTSWNTACSGTSTARSTERQDPCSSSDGNDTPASRRRFPVSPGPSPMARASVNAVFHALAKDSRLRVISSPSILVLDNHTAEIRVGDQQPVSTSTTTNTSNTDVVTQNIEFKDTGVLLEVTPRVNAGGLVIMDVAQEVTDVGNIDAATGQRSFLQRNIKSTVAVQSGETIVLGGLIRDNSSQTDTGSADPAQAAGRRLAVRQ